MLVYADQRTSELMRRHGIESDRMIGDAFQCDLPRIELLVELGWVRDDEPPYVINRARIADIAEPAERWKGVAEPGSALAAGLDAIVAEDPSFDAEPFIAGARAAYEMIVTAFAEGDQRALRNLLSREVFDGFDGAIRERDVEAAAGHMHDHLAAVRLHLMETRPGVNNKRNADPA